MIPAKRTAKQFGLLSSVMCVAMAFSLSVDGRSAWASCTAPTTSPFAFEVLSSEICTDRIVIERKEGSIDIAGKISGSFSSSVIYTGESLISSFTNTGEIISSGAFGTGVSLYGDVDPGSVGVFANYGTISADGTGGSFSFVYGLQFSGVSVGRFENWGQIAAIEDNGAKGDAIGVYISNSEGLVNYAINRGQITGTTTGMFVASNSRLVWFENAQGTRPGESALRYSGKLPENYSVIISNDGYGQLEGVDYDDDFGTIYPVSGIMTFGISNESDKITELSYTGVLSGISQELIENEAGGTYRGAQWSLVETATDSGIWDLVFSSLPLYNPSLEQVVAVPLSARSASFSQQFDGSRVVMHLAESRKREKTIVPTADVIYEGEQSDDTASMSQTIGATTLFGIIRGAWADFNAVGENPEYSANAWGMTFGAEHRFTGLDATFGVFGSYSETDSENSSSEDNVKNIGGGIHGNKELGAGFWLDGYGAYYHHDHDITRVDGGDIYTADPDGRTWTAYGRLSYADWDFSGLAFTPYVAANYVDQKLEAYDEKGSGGGALSVDEDKNWNVLTYVGSTLSADVPLTQTVSLLPKLDVAWVHLMKDGERNVTTTFVGSTDTFAATIAGSDQDFARVEASLGLSLDGGLAMRVDYATELGNSDVEKLHEVRLEATYQF